MGYKVKLDIFEGPLDLLLHLIKKSEVDIYDIPISDITEQYLEYIELMKDMNLDFAGEFLVMAATLVHIKSRMLLPIDAPDEDVEEGEDPRAELIKRLLEYQRYKDASEELSQRNILGRDVFIRGHDPSGAAVEEAGLINVSIFELMEALKEILKGARDESIMELTVERFNVTDKINHILDLLAGAGSAAFTSLFPEKAAKGEIIVTFLAVLELVKLLLIKIHQTDDGIIRVHSYNPEKSAV
ncbi:MAG: segregation and condensation protein A [Thermodesulfobacteriota bacterium]